MFAFVLIYIPLCSVYFYNHLEEEDDTGYFANIVLQMYFK